MQEMGNSSVSNLVEICMELQVKDINQTKQGFYNKYVNIIENSGCMPLLINDD